MQVCVGRPVPRPGRGGGLQAVDVVLEAVAAHGVAAELRALAPEHPALHLSCRGKVLHSVTQRTVRPRPLHQRGGFSSCLRVHQMIAFEE